MFIYFCMFSLIFFFMIAANDNNKKYKEVVFQIISIIFILIIGLRRIDMGISDTQYLYIPEFRRLQNMDIVDVFLKFKDPIFYVIAKIISLITVNENLWLTVCAAFYIIPVMNFIKKESKYPVLSIIMFIALNYFGMAFYGVRHCIALGILLYTYYPLKEKKLKKFLLIVLIASLFHISALIMIPMYWIINFINLNGRKSFILSSVFILIIFVLANLFGRQVIYAIMKILVESLKMERFSIYTKQNFSSLNNNIFYINFLIYIFSGWYNCNLNNMQSKDNKKLQLLMKYQLVGGLATGFVGVLGEMYRLSMFFSIFSIIALPEAIFLEKDKNKKRIYFWGLIVIFLVYFIFAGGENNNIIPYYFYWE